MKITRISKIKNHRIFRDFSWPTGLEDFSRFNLIYGWNGSGKTTLSSLFRSIEKKTPISEGEFDIVVDGNPCLGTSFATNTALPIVRVFNRDYVENSVFKISGDLVEPIFVLGEDSVEKQKEIEALRVQLETVRGQIANAQQVKNTADRSIDTFRQDKASSIKDLLGNDPNTRFRNYNKNHFKTKADAMAGDTQAATKVLSDADKQTLIQKQQEQPKANVAAVALALSALSELKTSAEVLLGTSVIAQTIQHLITHPEISAWVEEGLKHHPKGSTDCEFCGQKLPSTRLEELEGHFNDQLKTHTSALDAILAKIATDEGAIDALRLPVVAEFYADLATEYQASEKALQDAIAEHKGYLSRIASLVTEKRSKPFERVATTELASIPAASSVGAALTALNGTITKHATQTADFNALIEAARNALEEHIVAESLPDYTIRSEAVTDAATALDGFNTTFTTINNRIGVLDAEISEHARPADQLNQELRSYLGRSELLFAVEGRGYKITRHGSPALHLSEGEKTAIAFLHFLKKLESDAGTDAFDLKRDIVVIDDPVSSLDANALFCAYAFLKERTKEAGQLFVLTHNFTFFSLVRKWFSFMKKPERRFYMLETKGTANGRATAIAQLDKSLELFHSEYHFLFSRVHAEAHSTSTPAQLTDLYPLPNIARRLLETFLLFRRPGMSLDPNKVELDKKINSVAKDYDPVKKARILRFVQTFSHENKIAEEEHDLFLLGEARDVLRDVLDLLKEEDPEHHNGMLEAIGATPVATPATTAAVTTPPAAVGTAS
ncbi:MAG: hypothetical protein B7Z37_30675 [Verrucomicrobia bacterium 12-59-8]|nr:MAG: hypothetical protein B7Z37_30675 [Verrucomicrobia bacterium 12-59-8]